MKKNIYSEIEKLEVLSNEEIQCIVRCLEERLEELRDQEPDSCGVVYDTWDDKTTELGDLIESIQSVLLERDDQDIDHIKYMVMKYQTIFGGLKRLYL